jgi:hypothetical protein
MKNPKCTGYAFDLRHRETTMKLVKSTFGDHYLCPYCGRIVNK